MDFCKIALEEAEKSLCKKRKVGAVIIRSNEIRARGYNYIPFSKESNQIDSCEDADGNTRPEVVHAEIAAIENLRVLSPDEPKDFESTIYVTHPPCKNCQKAIDDAKLRLVVVNDFMKFDSGKLRYSLVPPVATRELAKVLTYGAKKYKPNNWQGVDDTDRYVDALYRHLEAWRSGEKLDSESRLSHLSHALANISFLLYFEDIDNINKN